MIKSLHEMQGTLQGCITELVTLKNFIVTFHEYKLEREIATKSNHPVILNIAPPHMYMSHTYNHSHY